jgi:hypothetical protein
MKYKTLISSILSGKTKIYNNTADNPYKATCDAAITHLCENEENLISSYLDEDIREKWDKMTDEDKMVTVIDFYGDDEHDHTTFITIDENDVILTAKKIDMDTCVE